MRKLFVLMLVMLLVGCGVETPEEPINEEPIIEEPVVEEPAIEEPAKQEHRVIILGPDFFVEDIENALLFIKENAPEMYRDFTERDIYVKLVDETYKTYAYFKKSSSIYFVEDYYNLPNEQPELSIKAEYMLPATLIHENTHVKDYHQNPDIPIEETERNALAAERRFYRLLGESEEDIERVAGEHLLETRWWENIYGRYGD